MQKNAPLVHSLYWKNINPSLIAAQNSVFKALNIPLLQEAMDGMNHGQWMTEILIQSDNNDVLIFCDIDAFPLTRAAYEKAVAHAFTGGIFGLAQTSNHTKTLEIYAGPMFLALRKDVWLQLGSPNLSANTTVDAAEILSIYAREQGISIELVTPVCCIKPKWALANKGVFGVGTFYGELEFFHLFQSREASSIRLIEKVANDVVNLRQLDFSTYLSIIPPENLCDQIASQINQISSWPRRIANMFLNKFNKA